MAGDKVQVDADACIDCGSCVDGCPVEALSL
jgi:NAD-dependent dihydropyrimidine dehydrogenase PreA subunit